MAIWTPQNENFPLQKIGNELLAVAKRWKIVHKKHTEQQPSARLQPAGRSRNSLFLDSSGTTAQRKLHVKPWETLSSEPNLQQKLWSCMTGFRVQGTEESGNMSRNESPLFLQLYSVPFVSRKNKKNWSLYNSRERPVFCHFGWILLLVL